MNTDFYGFENQTKESSYITEKIPGSEMISAIGVGVALVDMEGRLVTANQTLLALLGYSEPEIRNLEFKQLIDFQEMISGAGFFKKGGVLSKGERYQAEKRFPRKDGRTFWVRLTVSLMANEISAVDYFVVTMEDITRCKQAEEALIAEKKRLALTLGSIGDGVISTDNEGRIVFMNKTAEEITGWSQSDASGAPLEKIFVIRDPKTGVPIPDLVTSVLGTGKEMAALDLVLAAYQGKERLISFNVAPIRNTPENNQGVVLIFRDITKKRKMEHELLRSEKLESNGILAGGIAHDFNNILAGILANVQLARLSYQKGRDITKSLTGTEEAVKRAADLTKQLLSFSNSKGGSPMKEVIPVEEIIKDTVESALRGSQVKCEYALPENLWQIKADPGLMNQMIHNLIINADQAMPQGGIIQVTALNVQIKDEEVPLLKPGA
ncbi:MAG TPA: PAS domain S-box protein, partial [Bacillota bacterium]|nr:PAS domain S-box protein [Bacillota bacterium]